MTYSQTEIEQHCQFICNKFTTEITWRFEERFSVMLSEFSQMTSIKVIEELNSIFPHRWDHKNIKTAPIALFDQLSHFQKLTKTQLIFTIPASNSHPAFMAVLWPWGHGSTFSLRISPLASSYNMDDIRTSGKLTSWLRRLLT